MYSILAMDAYNREYGAGIEISGSHIGNAEFKDHEQSGVSPQTYQSWQDAGFYAISYSYDSKTVISYRGTDGNFWDELFNVDVPIFLGGDYTQFELGLASQFYQKVSETATNPLFLTGHSLGGALAGYTAALYGAEATIVDHIGFYNALNRFLDHWELYGEYTRFATNADALDQYEADNEISLSETDAISFGNVIEGLRRYDLDHQTVFDQEAIISFLGQSANISSIYLQGTIAGITRGEIPDLQATLPDVVGNTLLTSPKQAHSASLNVILKYAEQQNDLPDGPNTGANAVNFKPIFVNLKNALFDNNLAAAINIPGEGTDGIADAAGKMRDMIAYSALDEGTLVFGNTGIRSMFNDANQLGLAA